MTELFEHSNWIYEHSEDNRFRYVLGERGENPLVCIGVNPSTATPEKLDPTLRNVKAWAKRLGFDGWIMLNLYSQRATNPDDLPANRNAYHHSLNSLIVRSLALRFDALTIWAAWGTLIDKRKYLRLCLIEFMASFNVHTKPNWIHIGPLSAKGHPHHPLYLPRTAKVSEFDIQSYLKGFNL